MDDDDVLMLYLLYEKGKGKKSKWSAWMNALPQTLPALLCGSDKSNGDGGNEDEDEDDDEDEENDTLVEMRQDLRDMYDDLFPAMSDTFPAVFRCVFRPMLYMWFWNKCAVQYICAQPCRA